MNTNVSNPSRSTLAFLKTMAVVAIIGALNWGLIGLFNFNLVDAIFGGGAREETSTISRVVYSLVGIAGIVALFLLPAAQADVDRRSVPSH